MQKLLGPLTVKTKILLRDEREPRSRHFVWFILGKQLNYLAHKNQFSPFKLPRTGALLFPWNPDRTKTTIKFDGWKFVKKNLKFIFVTYNIRWNIWKNVIKLLRLKKKKREIERQYNLIRHAKEFYIGT